MKITKDQEQIVLNALTDSYLMIENEQKQEQRQGH